MAIWAHPSGTSPTHAEVLASIDRFRALGIDGVEAFYVTHTREQTRAARGALRRARPAQHRLGRLPRPRQPPVLAVPRVRDLRPRAEPRPDRAEPVLATACEAIGERLERQLLGDVQREAAAACRSTSSIAARAAPGRRARQRLARAARAGRPRGSARRRPRTRTARRAATAPTSRSARSSVSRARAALDRRRASAPSRS